MTTYMVLDSKTFRYNNCCHNLVSVVNELVCTVLLLSMLVQLINVKDNMFDLLIWKKKESDLLIKKFNRTSILFKMVKQYIYMFQRKN